MARVTSRLIGIGSLRDLTRIASSLRDSEDKIYRVLRLCNKKHVSEKLGKTRMWMYNGIRNRSFSIGELCSMLSVLQEAKEEEFCKEDKKDRIGRYKVMGMKDFRNNFNEKEKHADRGKEDVAVREVREDGGDKEQGDVSGLPGKGETKGNHGEG